MAVQIRSKILIFYQLKSASHSQALWNDLQRKREVKAEIKQSEVLEKVN